jgi:hypothetical protein
VDFEFDSYHDLLEAHHFVVTSIIFPRSQHCPWMYDQTYLSCHRKWGRCQWKIYIRPESRTLRIEKSITGAQIIQRQLGVFHVGDMLAIDHCEFWDDNLKFVSVDHKRLGRALRKWRKRSLTCTDDEYEQRGRDFHVWLGLVHQQRRTAAILKWWIQENQIPTRSDRPILTPIAGPHYITTSQRQRPPSPPHPSAAFQLQQVSPNQKQMAEWPVSQVIHQPVH